MAFESAEGAAAHDHGGEGVPILEVAVVIAGGVIEGRLRHDLAPVETSQVSGVVGLGDEAIGNEKVVAAVVVEIGKEGAPGPAAHGEAGFEAGVGEGAIPVVEEEGIPAGMALELGAGNCTSVGEEIALKGLSLIHI